MSTIQCPQRLLPESLECWRNCDRRRATQLLLSSGGACRPGTYLLRPCHSRMEKYALSVLQEERSNGGLRSLLCNRGSRETIVRNYLIKERPGGGYYIFSNQCFREVHYLIAYYGKPRRKMHTPLKYPFPRVVEAETSDTAAGQVGNASVKKLLADKDKRLQLMHKIGEGSYEMYSAELNGARVVSLVLDGGLEIPSLARPKEDAALDVSEKKPPLPPRPRQLSLLSPDLPPPPPYCEEKQICLQKALPVVEAEEGAGARRLLRSQIARCDRMVDRMLLRMFK